MSAQERPGPRLADRLAGLAASLALRALRRTLRLRFHDDAAIRQDEREGRHFILAFWHENLTLMRWGYRGRRMTVLISRSRDGELIAQAIRRLGIETARGSSSRGALAGFRELVRAARDGSDIAFTPDGPRGPARVAQPGAVAAAHLVGLPIYPVAWAASRFRRLGTWDRMPCPLPFAVVHFCYGPAWIVPRDADPAVAAAELKRRLDDVATRAAACAEGAMG